MSLLLGCRVVRGPDWNWKDQDGGEGHLGTITALVWPEEDQKERPENELRDKPASAVKVTWDVGTKGNYQAGFQGKYDLRMTDNAPAGVSHRNTRCVGCAADHIAGICWRCTVCLNCNLCTECYMTDCHDLDHPFSRSEEEHYPGRIVEARRDSERVRARGLLPGSKVSRGPDWTAGEQDGGRKRVGVVMEVCDWSECHRRGGVVVQWDEQDDHFRYSVGHDGKMEIRATEAAPGLEMYRDHFPSVGSTNRWTVGEKMLVAMDTESMKLLHEETSVHWDNSLVEKICVVGKLDSVDYRGWYQIIYEDGTKWRAPPFVFKKHTVYQAGDRVRVCSNTAMIKELQPGHGGWSTNMKKSVGREGSVVSVEDDDVKVEVDGQTWTFHPAAVTSLESNDDETKDMVAMVAEEREEKQEEQEIENIITNDNNPKQKAKPTPIPIPAGEEGGQRHLGDKVTRLLGLLEKLKASESGPGLDKHMVRAAAMGCHDKVQDCLKRNPKMANASYGNRTALQVACHEGHLRVVQILVDGHASLEEKDAEGDTALSYAVIGNNPSITDYLLSQRAYVNATNKRRRTPLHISAHKGHQACVELLLKYDASVNMQDNDGNLPIHLAMRQDKVAILPLLTNHATADLRLRNAVGFTPLHYAAKKGCTKAVELLVAKDPSLCNIQKNDGYTPLHLAVVNGQTDVTRILMQATDCNLPTTERGGKTTPLHLATWQGHSAVIELLVDHGVKVNEVDKDGDTALHLAVQRRRSGKKVVQDTPTLTKLREDLNDPAIAAERDALLAYLIRHGSDVTIENDSEFTPLHYVKDAALKRSLSRLAGIKQTDDDNIFTDNVDKNGLTDETEEKRSTEEKHNIQPVKEKDVNDKEKRRETTASPHLNKERKKSREVVDNGSFEGIHRIDPAELTLGRTVGRGGFGEVKKAVWRGTTVAVKILSTAGSKESDVEKEISIHKRARHPNIVSLMAVGHEIGQALVVMEYIDGRDLFDVIFKKPPEIPLTPEVKVDIATGLLSALTFLHASKILHLDIKPSNIMVEQSSKRAYLCDLGLAHIKTRSSMSLSTSIGGPRGTITHMAPEMVQREGGAWAGPGNDIWSIACTFLELFVEQKLWKGMEFMMLLRTLLKPDTIPPILEKASPEIKAILTPCLCRDPLQRPSADTLLKQFQALEQS